MRRQISRLFSAAALLLPFTTQPAVSQDYFSTQTDPQSGQPVQGWRPTDRGPYKQQQQKANQNQNENSIKVTGQGLQRLNGSAESNQFNQPPGGFVRPYGKPVMVNPTPQNLRDNPESVYYGKASAIPRPYQRQLPIGVPIQGTNSLGANATQLNGSANQNSRPKPAGHQSVFNLTILVPDATFSGKRGINHYVTVMYPGHHPRLAGDNGVNPVNTSWADVDVIDKTEGVVPITQIRASYSRASGNRGMLETIYVERAWTAEHPKGFKAGATAHAQ
ncbi:MAG: hypothetical protein U0105_09390 [Candidatus Obscuribacterales bacterium]